LWEACYCARLSEFTQYQFKLAFTGENITIKYNGNQYFVNAGQVVSESGQNLDAIETAEVMANCEKRAKRIRAARSRRLRDLAMESCGLVKVHGALGGTYWE
jgi:hypothetical protein